MHCAAFKRACVSHQKAVKDLQSGAASACACQSYASAYRTASDAERRTKKYKRASFVQRCANAMVHAIELSESKVAGCAHMSRSFSASSRALRSSTCLVRPWTSTCGNNGHGQDTPCAVTWRSMLERGLTPIVRRLASSMRARRSLSLFATMGLPILAASRLHHL